MSFLRNVATGLWLLFRKRRAEEELDEELHDFLAMAVQEKLRQGVGGQDALRAVRLERGSLEVTKQMVRSAAWESFLESCWQDLRFAARTLGKSPGFTAVAVLTLALGIGANTAIFSLVNGILLLSLPYSKPEQLLTVTGSYPRGAFVAMREQTRTMDVAAYAEGHEFNLTGFGEPVRLAGALVSAELFSVLGARPELGRALVHGEDVAGKDHYVILSHALWQRRFGSDPTIVGRSIELEGVSREVVGVMPRDFRFPSTSTELWIPLHNDPGSIYEYWAGDFMPVIGRLRSGSTLRQARAEIQLFQSRVGALFPWPMPASWNADVSAIPLQNGMVADVRTRLLTLLGAVALVLLIACTNVANLTLSRAATREKEIAVRAAMGAPRHRIVGQLLTESVLLGSFGAAAGFVLAKYGLSSLKALLPADTPRLAEVHMDWRVLAFTAALGILTGLLSGLAPALQTARPVLAESLKAGGRGASVSVSQRLRGGLVVAEVAFAVLLVTSAGLLIRSFWMLSHVNLGFRSEHILTARITPDQQFSSDAARCITFYRSVLEHMRTFPGVTDAALVNTLPLGGRVSKRSLELEGYLAAPGTAPLFWLDIVTPDYFEVMGIPVFSGRGFVDGDTAGAPVAVITSQTARRYWPNQSAVGKHLRLLDDQEWRTVIGVVPDVRAYNLERSVPHWIDGTAYVLYNANATVETRRVPAEMTMAIRTSAADSQIEAELRSSVARANPAVPISEVRGMGSVVSDAASTPASTTLLFATFAAVALALGIVGIYGVLSFLVSRRTREIAIRMALGAQRSDLLRLVMKEGAKLCLSGVTAGIAGAFLLTRLISSELYGVSPLDPATYLAVSLVMTAVTLLACYVPTRRAMRLDPLVALRQD